MASAMSQLRPNMTSLGRSLAPRLGALAAAGARRGTGLQVPRLHHLRRAGAAAPLAVRAMSGGSLVDEIKTKNEQSPVIVYSKTYCPYCKEVKQLFGKLEVPFKLVELDDLADGDQVQSALSEVSGFRTVPQVFVGGKLIGGCDDTLSAYSSGKLKEALQAAGVTAKM